MKLWCSDMQLDTGHMPQTVLRWSMVFRRTGLLSAEMDNLASLQNKRNAINLSQTQSIAPEGTFTQMKTLTVALAHFAKRKIRRQSERDLGRKQVFKSTFGFAASFWLCWLSSFHCGTEGRVQDCGHGGPDPGSREISPGAKGSRC